MTTIYLMRHSIPFGSQKGIVDTNDSILLENIKSPLSVEGEKLASNISNKEEFSNLDVVWSSNYVRAMSTAKYFAYKNHIKVNISDRFNERIHGVNAWDELPSDFEIKQFNNENYKIGNGENQKEVRERMYDAIESILNNYKNNRILIVGHSTSFTFLLKKWCDVNYNGNYSFHNKVFFDGIWKYCQTFKLSFDNQNELVKIENISS